ncbi:MAG: DNA recombination protein RmuC [Fibrobacterota bacterium]
MHPAAISALMFISGAAVSAAAVFILLKNKHNRKEEELLIKLREEEQKRITAETRLEEKTKASEEATKSLKETFDSLAAKALSENGKSFMNLARETFDNYLNQSKGDLGKRQEAIEHMLKPFKENLQRHEKLTKDLENATKESFGGLRNYLDKLSLSQQNLSKETNALVTALKSPKARGKWGEIGLKRIVEFSGMSEYCHFSEQTNITTEDGRLRPDMIVYLPGERSIVVDSKVPLDAYMSAVETENEAEKDAFMRTHSRHVRDHMKRLSSKSYWSQVEGTVDFVILYMEVESAFGASLAYDKNLIQDGINNRIIFATPTTLITLLRTVAFTWNQQKVADNARAVWDSGRELFERLAKFTEHFTEVGKGIEKAVKSYNGAVGTWESRIGPAARKLEDVGGYQLKKEKEDPSKIDSGIREISS